MATRIATAVAFALATAALPVGCAVGNATDDVPASDPALPEVDAGSSSLPAFNDAASKLPDASPDAPSAPSDSGASDSGSDAGSDAGADAAVLLGRPDVGEVLVTEVMYNPFGDEPEGEWFEVYNRMTKAFTLSGLVIKDGSGRTHVIKPGVTIAAESYLVFVRNRVASGAAKVPDVAKAYEYGTGLPDNAGILLGNGATGAVWLYDGAKAIAKAPYGDIYSQSGGSSVQLRTATFAASAEAANWCLSMTPWAVGAEKGTPWKPHDCPTGPSATMTPPEP